MASQCTHRFLFFLLADKLKYTLSVHNTEILSLGDRYKIYIEGSAWSVSEKYILACDSMTLVVTPKYYDFYSRVLMPMQHYWPIWDDNKCSSIKFAVDWGNSHKQKVSFCVHLYYIIKKGRPSAAVRAESSDNGFEVACPHLRGRGA